MEDTHKEGMNKEGDRKKLGILLTTSPENGNTNTAIQLSRAAAAQGIEVSIFLMADGVYNVNSEDFLELLDVGIEIALCDHNATERKIAKEEKGNYGSLYDLAVIAHETDRLISF